MQDNDGLGPRPKGPPREVLRLRYLLPATTLKPAEIELDYCNMLVCVLNAQRMRQGTILEIFTTKGWMELPNRSSQLGLLGVCSVCPKQLACLEHSEQFAGRLPKLTIDMLKVIETPRLPGEGAMIKPMAVVVP